MRGAQTGRTPATSGTSRSGSSCPLTARRHVAARARGRPRRRRHPGHARCSSARTARRSATAARPTLGFHFRADDPSLHAASRGARRPARRGRAASPRPLQLSGLQRRRPDPGSSSAGRPRRSRSSARRRFDGGGSPAPPSSSFDRATAAAGSSPPTARCRRSASQADAGRRARPQLRDADRRRRCPPAPRRHRQAASPRASRRIRRRAGLHQHRSCWSSPRISPVRRRRSSSTTRSRCWSPSGPASWRCCAPSVPAGGRSSGLGARRGGRRRRSLGGVVGLVVGHRPRPALLKALFGTFGLKISGGLPVARRARSCGSLARRRRRDRCVAAVLPGPARRPGSPRSRRMRDEVVTPERGLRRRGVIGASWPSCSASAPSWRRARRSTDVGAEGCRPRRVLIVPRHARRRPAAGRVRSSGS